jgi:hypothetical protein
MTGCLKIAVLLRSLERGGRAMIDWNMWAATKDNAAGPVYQMDDSPIPVDDSDPRTGVTIGGWVSTAFIAALAVFFIFFR